MKLYKLSKTWPQELSSDGMIDFLCNNAQDCGGEIDYSDAKHMVMYGGKYVLQSIPLSVFPYWTDFEGMDTSKVNDMPIVTLGPNYDWEIIDGKHRIAVANALGKQNIMGYVFVEDPNQNN
ncbi:MAG: hypothetical protein WC119_00985 [Synergistaceae bacterium]